MIIWHGLKKLKNHIFRLKNVIFDRFQPFSKFQFSACKTLVMMSHDRLAFFLTTSLKSLPITLAKYKSKQKNHLSNHCISPLRFFARLIVSTDRSTELWKDSELTTLFYFDFIFITFLNDCFININKEVGRRIDPT